MSVRYKLRFRATRDIKKFVGFGVVNLNDGEMLPTLLDEEAKERAMALGCFEIISKESDAPVKEPEVKKAEKVTNKKQKKYSNKGA